MSRRQQIWTLTVLCCAVGLIMGTLTSLYTAGPDLGRAIGASQTDLTWIIDAYTVGLAGLLLPAGALGDRFGRREVMIVGLLLFVAASIALQFADSPGPLIAIRILLGVSAALILPSTLSLITSTFPEDFRDTAVGIWTAAFTLAGALAIVITGLLLDFFSWRSSFWSVLAGGVLVLLASFTMPNSREEHPPPIDPVGSALAAIAITALVFGLIDAGLKGWSDPLIIGAVALGLLMCVLFAVSQLRMQEPLLDVRMFRNRPFGVSAFTVMAAFAAVYGLFFMTMEYEQFVLGYSALKAGVPVLSMCVTVIPISLVASRLTTRFGLRAVITVGCLLSMAAFLVFLTYNAHTTYGAIFLTFLCAGAGTGLNMAPCTSAILNTVSAEKQGVAAAVNHTTRELGTALGVALLGGVLNAGYRSRIHVITAHLPPVARDASRESLPGALAVAQRLGRHGARLAHLTLVAHRRGGSHRAFVHGLRVGRGLERTAAHLAANAQTAFVGGIHQTCIVMAAVMAAVAVIAALWAPRLRRADSSDRLRERPVLAPLLATVGAPAIRIGSAATMLAATRATQATTPRSAVSAGARVPLAPVPDPPPEPLSPAQPEPDRVSEALSAARAAIIAADTAAEAAAAATSAASAAASAATTAATTADAVAGAMSMAAAMTAPPSPAPRRVPQELLDAVRPLSLALCFVLAAHGIRDLRRR